jgi:hypothetical protein
VARRCADERGFKSQVIHYVLCLRLFMIVARAVKIPVYVCPNLYVH